MATVTHKSYLNMVSETTKTPVIHVGQYDDDFTIEFYLIAVDGKIVPKYPTSVTSNVTFSVPNGATAEVRGTKRDGNGYSANATITSANNLKCVTVTGHQQMTACAGENIFEIVLKYNNKVISTANFILDVERAAMDADTIQSDTVLKELNAIINSASISTAAAAEAEDAADRAEAAAATLEIDDTLTHTGQAADAKKVGDEINDLKDDFSHIVPGLSGEAKEALLACFRNVAWLDWEGSGQSFYHALADALYSGDDPRIAYEIPRGTDISTWAIDTNQHAYTLDEDFTFIAKVTTETAGTEQPGMFLIDAQSTSGSVVGMRVQGVISDGGVKITSQFNGGAVSSGAGGQTNNSFPMNVDHNVIAVIRNNNKSFTIKTYVDGTLEYQDSRTLTDKQNTYPSTYYIGKNHNDVERLWLGTVDIYRIYNVALTDAEITNILGLS